MKFGIIVTDDDEKWGGEKGVGEYIIHRFETTNSEHNQFVAIHAVTGDLPADDDLLTYNGFMLTGSHFSVNDNFEWKDRLEVFIRKCYYTAQEFGKPRMVGVCFGHQLIAKALGGTVGKNPDNIFNFGSCEIQIDDELRNQSYVKKHFRRRKNSLTLMKFHGECVLKPPQISETVGASIQCKHEILKYGDMILTMQGHPEYTKKAMTDTNAYIMKRIGRLDLKSIKQQLSSINEQDADKSTSMVLSFLKHSYMVENTKKQSLQRSQSIM